MRLVDSHSHLFLDEFQSDLQQVMAHAQAAGVTHNFMPNIDSTTIEPMLRVCSEYKGYCFPMMGLHPTSVNADYKKELAIVSEHLAMPNDYVAIGEIGMDLYWDKTFLKEQQFVFSGTVCGEMAGESSGIRIRLESDMSILNVEHLTHGFGDRAIFNDVSFRLLKGEHIGLVGANGEGKSTFMSIVTGKMLPDEGLPRC